MFKKSKALRGTVCIHFDIKALKKKGFEKKYRSWHQSMPITIEITYVHNDLSTYISSICCWWGHFPFLHRIRYPPYSEKKGSIVRWIMKKKPQKSGIQTLIPYFLFGTIFAVLFKVNKVIILLIVTEKRKLFISLCIILIFALITLY